MTTAIRLGSLLPRCDAVQAWRCQSGRTPKGFAHGLDRVACGVMLVT